MYELIYFSTAREDLQETDIDDILAIASQFNKENNITGCLLYYKHEFLQLLEGDQAVIDALYERICADKRHYDVALLYTGEKGERTFKKWSIAFHSVTDKDINGVSEEMFKSNFIQFSELADKPSLAVHLFWYMAKEVVS